MDWRSLVPWAIRGIADMVDDGEISEGVATSLYQRVVNWRDAMAMLGERVGLPRVTPRGPVFHYKDSLGRSFRYVGRDRTIRKRLDPRNELGLPPAPAGTINPRGFVK